MRKILAAVIICTLILSLFVSFQNAEAASAKIISRAVWGADENLRLYSETNPEPELITLPSDFYLRYAPELILNRIVKQTKNGVDLTWPLQYPEKITKIIIHHTASTKNPDNPMQAVRDIYNYHAISRGWGDIGYNYIIDTNGTIYEGRYGGEAVVGAHAGPGNRGSIGIAVLGNYNENELTPEALRALETIITEKSKLYGIDPLGESYFRGKKLPNIFGHSAIMATSCPGKNITNLLPQLRKDVADLNGKFDYAKVQKSYDNSNGFEYLSPKDPITLPPDKKMEFQIKIRNNSKITWGEGTRLKLDANAFIQKNFGLISSLLKESKVLPGQTGTFNITVMTRILPGFSYISFVPIINGNTQTGDEINVPTIIEKPYFAYEFVDMAMPTTHIKSGDKMTAIVTLKNAGNTIWRNFGDQRICLGADNPRDRTSAFTNSSRMGYLKENRVNPGQKGHFVFTLKGPRIPGLYEEYFAPVIEKVTWLDGNGMKIPVNVYNDNLNKVSSI